MKRLNLSILFCICHMVFYAQTADFEWAASFGATSFDKGHSITSDPDGNVYSMGLYSGTVDFDPGPGTYNLTAGGFQDAYIQKLDSNGNFVWVIPIETVFDGEIKYKSGFIYVVASFNDTADFQFGPTTQRFISNGDADAFILKLDLDGNLEWAKSFGGKKSDHAIAVSIDDLGNVHVTGNYSDTVDFDPGPVTFNLNSAGVGDVFILKLDSNGNFIWAKSVGGTESEISNSVNTDANGNVVVTGTYKSTPMDFDPSAATYNLSAVGLEDAFVLMLDSSGDFRWANSMGGTSNDDLRASTIDGLGNIYITGSFHGTSDFDPGPSIHNLSATTFSHDIFVEKFDNNGNFIWAKSIGGSSYNTSIGHAISNDASNNVYILGWYGQTVDFDPGSSTHNVTASGFSQDVFMLKLKPNADFLWVKSFGGNLNDFGFAMDIGTSGNIYTTGFYYNTVDFDPGTASFPLTSNGNADIFVQKFSCGSSSIKTDTIIACKKYTWIDGLSYTSSNNTAVYILPNASGCDSVINLDLTIIPVDVTVSSTNSELTSNAIGASYQWLNCDANFAVISGEIAKSFIPTVNGSYAVEVTENGCIDTSACINLVNVGMQEKETLYSISIYPNPTDGNVQIELNNLKDVSIKIFGARGQLFYSQHGINSNVHQFNFDAPKGIYVVEVNAQNNKQQFKLIKN